LGALFWLLFWASKKVTGDFGTPLPLVLRQAKKVTGVFDFVFPTM
jgi:hypothetical protein